MYIKAEEYQLDPSDEELREDAKSLVRKARRRYSTYRKNALQARARGELVIVHEPFEWLRQQTLEDLYNKRYHPETRQKWARKQLPQKKRRKFFDYVGELFTEWTGYVVIIRKAISYSFALPEQPTMRADVRSKK